MQVYYYGDPIKLFVRMPMIALFALMCIWLCVCLKDAVIQWRAGKKAHAAAFAILGLFPLAVASITAYVLVVDIQRVMV